MIFTKIFPQSFAANLVEKHGSTIFFQAVAACAVNVKFIFDLLVHFFVELVHIDLRISDPDRIADGQQPS